MKMQSHLQGRLRNTSLASTSGLVPLFEAVVNSIEAIEERGAAVETGAIRIDIVRTPQQKLIADDRPRRGPEAADDIDGFVIVDNGIGFNDANMSSFDTLDSDHKASKGCRGVGRLSWLKAFRRVTVDSTYKAGDGGMNRRVFTFDSMSGVSNVASVSVDNSANQITSIRLDGFSSRYRKNSKKTGASIAQSIVEHCLWYFLRDGGVPDITVVDDGQAIVLADVFKEQMHAAAVHEKIAIKSHSFELLHVKLRSSLLSAHAIALCAANRLVLEEKIAGKIQGLHGKISDSDGAFTYSCYVNSPYLDEFCRPERTGFDIADRAEGLLEATEVTLEDIREAVLERAKLQLKDFLDENMRLAKDRVDKFVSYKAPRYRPILSRIPEGALDVDSAISDKELELVLHKQLAEMERELLQEGHEIMAPRKGEGIDGYRSRLASYLSKAEDIKKSDLANYVSHRRVILDMLEKALQRGGDGKYQKEEIIHDLIMPLRKDSTEVLLDSCNLWIVDERLAFHEYLSSDKPLTAIPLIESAERKEPDLLSINIFDNPILVSDGSKMPLASIVVVEIKRPMRNNAKVGEIDDPIEQALGYLERVREGKIKSHSGRPISQANEVPGYCYVLCDITPTIRQRCKLHDLTLTADGLGYFAYKASYKDYVEVISFDRLINSAKERNRAFFDKLGLPTN